MLNTCVIANSKTANFMCGAVYNYDAKLEQLWYTNALHSAHRELQPLLLAR